MRAPDVVLGVIAGLALFLYGVAALATGMREVAGDRMRAVLARATRNRLVGVVSGFAATAVLDSSSVTIILVIALVDAGLLSFVQSLGVILGANIGTTVSSQLIALDVTQYAPIVLALGVLLHLGGRRAAVRHAGLAVIGLGLVFFGLGQLGDAVAPLRGSPRFAGWMTALENPLLGVATGGIVTLVLQSSSATVGIAITLAAQGLMELPAGIAVMLGAEIGTCADTLVATLGRSRAAIRAGVFHLAFNVAAVVAGVLLIAPLTALAAALGGGLGRQIANAHVAFNVIGAMAMLPFLGPAARALAWLVPDRPAGPPLHAAGPAPNIP